VNPAAPRPNILFIFADDWGWGDLSCQGHPWLKTPNIDRLAREGTDFLQFNVLNPVCSPSRTAVLTGRYPARFCIHQHFASQEPRFLSAASRTGGVSGPPRCCSRLGPENQAPDANDDTRHLRAGRIDCPCGWQLLSWPADFRCQKNQCDQRGDPARDREAFPASRHRSLN